VSAAPAGTRVPVLDPRGVTVGAAQLAPEVAGQPIKPHLVHETAVAELGARRAGTHSTKTRAEVRGGGAKPWRQKGTGRARQGSIRAPQWTGGGVVFGPTPRQHGGKVNRKVRLQAFRATLRAHAERGTLALMEPHGWDVPSTKRAAEYLRQAPDGLAARPLLVVVEEADGITARAFRNLAGVGVLPAAGLGTVDVASCRALLVERAAWERIGGALGEVEAVKAKPKPAPGPVTPPPESKLTAREEPAAPPEEPEPAADAEEEPEAAAGATEDAAPEAGEPEDEADADAGEAADEDDHEDDEEERA
jgi:large subunit ribosomal protein L4